MLNRKTWPHLEPRPGEYDPPHEMRGSHRVEKKGHAVVTVHAAPRPVKTEPVPPDTSRQAPRTAKAAAAKKHPRYLDENTVRAIRRTYRPGVPLRQLEEQFGLTGGGIVSVANRCTYDEYPTGKNEYEPPPHIRGTKRREHAPPASQQERQALPVYRPDTKHLMPEAIQAIHEAIDDGEPIRRIARCFGLMPEAIEHMKQSSRTN